MIYKLTDGNQFLLGVFFQTGGGFGKVVRIQLLMIGKSCGAVFGQCDSISRWLAEERVLVTSPILRNRSTCKETVGKQAPVASAR